MSNETSDKMNKKKSENTDSLIGQLCEGLKPVKPCCPYKSIAPWFALSLLYLAGVVSYLGLRHDFFEQITQANYLFEMALGVLILITAALSSSWLNTPDGCQKTWIKPVPMTLLAVFFLWVLVRTIEEGTNFKISLHMGHCAHEGLLMEVIPLIFLFFVTMRGYTTQPYWSMAMNVLAISSLGWLGLRLTCTMDAMGHSFFNHLLPFAIVSAGLAFFARKLFKW